ncbi:hypothetical protein HYW87_05010 [Candidatus Roizmanbacteria bacterium]|nr:hypothetical protein [Candidatus Roizmanbacteria bacterium]
MKLNAKELRELEEKRAQGTIHEVKRQSLYFILENIYDTYNIGGLFRLADALAVEKMYLCGEIEIPPNTRIKKASIGTYKVVPWEYRKSAADAIADLRETWNIKHKTSEQKENKNTFHVSSFKFHVVAVEQHLKAINYTKASYQLPLALVFGNETAGVLPETLKLVDQIVEIPMWGINKSLNVIVSAAIVSYWAVSKIKE